MANIGTRTRPKTFLWLVILLILSLVVAGIFWWLRMQKPPNRPFVVPGSSGLTNFTPSSIDSEAITLMANRLQANLQSGAGLVSWYQQANEELEISAQWSLELTAENQLLYGFWLAEQKQVKQFASWHRSFRDHFLSEDGLVYSARNLVPAEPIMTLADLKAANDLEPVTTGNVSWPDSLHYFRVLALAYAQWPSDELDQEEQQLEQRLLQVIGEGLAADQIVAIPTSAPTQDPAATPTPNPTPSSETKGAGFTQDPVVRLASLDLLALKGLAQMDPQLESRFDEARDLVQDGLISDGLPLYAYGFATDQQGYVRFVGSAPVIDLADSLTSTLHLAEVDELDSRTLSWLTEHLLNDGKLYAAYHIAQDQPSTTAESLEGLALTARIARIAGSKQLYTKAVERLLWHQATSQTSSVLDAIFQQDSQGVVSMAAKDNLLALLALS